nr:telomere repeat-binding protein 5-like [Tanacetum cinerariifolium]
RPNTPQKVIESGYHLRLKSEGGTKTSGFMSKQNPAFIPMVIERLTIELTDVQP